MGEIGALCQVLRESGVWPATGWEERFADEPVVFNGDRIELPISGASSYTSVVPSPPFSDKGGPHTFSTRAYLPLFLEGDALNDDESEFLFGCSEAYFDVHWDSGSTDILLQWRSGGGLSSRLYDPIAHNWLSIRHDGADVFYEASSDGVSWATLFDGPEESVYSIASLGLNVSSSFWQVALLRNSPGAGGVVLAIGAAPEEETPEEELPPIVYQRLYGFTIDIEDDGTERVTNILTATETGS